MPRLQGSLKLFEGVILVVEQLFPNPSPRSLFRWLTKPKPKPNLQIRRIWFSCLQSFERLQRSKKHILSETPGSQFQSPDKLTFSSYFVGLRNMDENRGPKSYHQGCKFAAGRDMQASHPNIWSSLLRDHSLNANEEKSMSQFCFHLGWRLSTSIYTTVEIENISRQKWGIRVFASEESPPQRQFRTNEPLNSY